MDSNYTVAKIIKSTEVEGKFGPQLRIAFTTNETGEKMLSVFSKYELKSGQKISGSITEKDGTKQDGSPVTYYNFNFAKRASVGGISEDQFQKIYREVYATRQELVMLRQLLQERGIIPKKNAHDTTVEYPEGPDASNSFEEPPIEAYV